MSGDLDLARRLVAHPRFRWAPGMKIADHGPGIRYCWQDETHLHGAAEEGGAWMRIPKSRIGDGPYLPDLADAATAGVLLDMLADAMPLRAVAVCRERPVLGLPYVWWVEGQTGDLLGEAAARALLALWEASRG